MTADRKKVIDAAEEELKLAFIDFIHKQAAKEHDLRKRTFDDAKLEAAWLCFVAGAAMGVRQCTRFLKERFGE